MNPTSHAPDARWMLLRAMGIGAAAGFLALVLVFTLPLALPDAGTVPLLLPAAHAGPGNSIPFYGTTFDGDAFVWCLDKSASMGWQSELSLMRAQVTLAVDSLSPAQEFSLVAFSSNTVTWSSVPQPATPANKEGAIAWLNTLTADGWSCMLQACLQALDILDLATGAEREMFVVGDKSPLCLGMDTSAQVLADVTAANSQGYPIHTVFLQASAAGWDFFQSLADFNNGTFIAAQFLPDMFRRGDVNGSGSPNLADAIGLLAYQFVPGTPPPGCFDAADVNDDGAIEVVVDALYLLSYPFVPGSPPPPGPFAACSYDATADGLECASYPPCP